MPRLSKLLVIVPGIGGSVLSYPSGASAWQVSGRSLARTLVHPERLDLDEFPDLVPLDLTRTFSGLAPLVSIAGYESLVKHVEREFDDVVTHVHTPGRRVPAGVDVLLYPYDFRRSVTEAATGLAGAVSQALAGCSRAERKDKVVVLAHSLGGLVARYWVAAEGGAHDCAALLTLGTPHRGAPKALDWLVNGAGWGRFRHWRATAAIRKWPSMYELLPQYEAVWDERAGHEIELTSLPPDLAALGPLPDFAADFASGAARARAVHSDTAAAWAELPPDDVPVVAPFLARGHATANLVTLTGGGHLLVSKEDPPWRGNVGWAGDGTVPALSAVPRELGDDPRAWQVLTDRHGDMAATPDFVPLLVSLCGAALPTRGDTRAEPSLGIDLEDVVPAGQSIAVGVVGQPSHEHLQSVQVTVRSVAGATPPMDAVTGTPVDGSFRLKLPGLAAGAYSVLVEGWTGERPLFHRTGLFVMNDMEGER